MLWVGCGCLDGNPSTVFWTVCTTDVYATGTGHIEEDAYFTPFNRRGHGASFPPDTSFELGAFSWKEVSAEAGVDYLGGTDDPLYFNMGLAIADDKLFKGAPAFKVGCFNVGTRNRGSGRTDENIVDLIMGVTLPEGIGGRFCLGGFSGSRAIGKNRQGFMVSYQRFFHPAKSCKGVDYFKWVLSADYASGKNAIGGGGVGLGYYFTPDIYVLTGPVWFNSAKINGSWKWSVQLAINFSLFDPKKAIFPSKD